MSIWVQLWFAILAIADRLLGTRLAERELARLQRRIADHEAQANAIRAQMEKLNCLLHTSQVEFCVLYLRQRRLLRPEAWLCFTPTESADEEKVLDTLISRLVKHGLASVRTEALGEQTYTYHLCPNWAAITALLASQKEYLDGVTLSWLEEIQNKQTE